MKKLTLQKTLSKTFKAFQIDWSKLDHLEHTFKSSKMLYKVVRVEYGDYMENIML